MEGEPGAAAGGAPPGGATAHDSGPLRRGTVRHIGWESYGHGPHVPVVLLHGVTDSAACWRPVAPRWAAAGRVVVAVDARGHGHSALPRAPFTVEALAAETEAVIREVIGGPVVVVGHSLGGLTAEELALGAPDLVRSLVLEDPAWRHDREADARGVPGFLHPFVRSFAGASRGQLEMRSRLEHPHWPDDEHAPWAASKRQLDQGLVDVQHRWDDRNWVEALAGVRVPVTLVTGDVARGAIVDVHQVERAAELLGPLLTHVPVPGAGHSIRRDDRETFVSAVERTLAAADAAATGLAG